ncbi:MAG: SLC13 family permease [Candidatus Methanomethylophilus sp.]|nr:SLC13 family permease [Methanomethylophilus sp.]MDD4222221.1 SLC13 family permease [Methanomethylophilus sp.]MDD4668454.1 SLC13 family permease [Methanomethylophilus sp.]
MSYEFTAALLIFLVTYSLIAVRKFRGRRIKTYVAAIIGGALMLLCGVVTPGEAVSFINMPVLLQLLGMMMLTAALEYCGFFEIIVDWLMRRFRDRQRFLTGVMIITAVLAAVMLNDAVVLIFAPIVLRCCVRMRADPAPYLVGVFIAANIGSAATVVGNPQNALVAAMAGLGFAEYSVRVIPLAVICMAVAILMLGRLYQKQITEIVDMTDQFIPVREVNRPRLYAVLGITAAALVLFTVSSFIGLAIWQIALAAGFLALLVVMTKKAEAAVYVAKHVDWSILLFFIGLFVVIAGVVSSGLLDSLSGLFGLGNGEVPSVAGLTVFSAVLANLVSNVPSVMLIGELLPADNMVLWITLAVTSTFAGNATLIGAAANLIVQDEGDKHGVHLSAWRYLRIGLPVAVVTLAIAAAYLTLLSLL